MSDIKLFRISGQHAEELPGESVALERSLQALMERHLTSLLGVRFLASEYSTGKKHGGRIDTLGIDENGAPVIIEYKRAVNENVINQGLFYLDWLLDHKAELELLVMERLGAEEAADISWEGTRLLCIAGGYTRYDLYAVGQINRNIELLRYERFGDDLLLIDLVNRVNQSIPADDAPAPTNGAGASNTYTKATPLEALEKGSDELKDLYDELLRFAEGLGDDVQVKALKMYIAVRRLKNFICIEPHPMKGTLTILSKVDPDTVELKPGFTRDVRNIGHYGTGELEVSIGARADLEAAQPLIARSYEAS